MRILTKSPKSFISKLEKVEYVFTKTKAAERSAAFEDLFNYYNYNWLIRPLEK